VQALRRLLALCRGCHASTHYGLAEVHPRLRRRQEDQRTEAVHRYRHPRTAEQDAWVAAAIEHNLRHEDLRYDDIVVINPDPISARSNLEPIRRHLLERGIASHHAGVDTTADVFFRPEEQSITFTGIFRAKGRIAATTALTPFDFVELILRAF
jgi:superfamily I DNA and RNA helicase